MTPVIVNDASCLIDLRKGNLLAALCDLPYRIVVPLPVRENELLDFSERQWRMLDDAGVITHDLTPEEVGQSLQIKGHHPGLSANDCFCLVTTRTYSGILLTGDALLRKAAIADGQRVHGVLWVVDELEAAGICSKSLLVQALGVWRKDNAVFLPERGISERLERLSSSIPVSRSPTPARTLGW